MNEKCSLKAMNDGFFDCTRRLDYWFLPRASLLLRQPGRLAGKQIIDLGLHCKIIYSIFSFHAWMSFIRFLVLSKLAES